MIYNVVLVSSVKQRDSVITTHISVLFQILGPQVITRVLSRGHCAIYSISFLRIYFISKRFPSLPVVILPILQGFTHMLPSPRRILFLRKLFVCLCFGCAGSLWCTRAFSRCGELGCSSLHELGCSSLQCVIFSFW